MYSLQIEKNIIKTLETIDEPYYTKIKKAILALASNPRPQGYKKLKGRNAYRIRIAHYSVIYHIIDTKLLVQVIDLGHRKDIYE